MAEMEDLLTPIAGVDDINSDPHPPEPAADPAPAPVTPPEPSVAEIIAQELGKVTSHIDSRFAEYDTKLEGMRTPAAPVEPAKPEAWKPTTWDDFPALVEQKGEEAARRILKERDDAIQSANDAAAQTQKQIDDHIDGQVNELERSGKLPAITDPNSADDPGKLARQELFGFAAHLGTPNLASAQATLDALHATGQRFDHKVNQILNGPKPNPGKNSPIGSSSGSASTTPQSGPTYKDISTLDPAELLRRFPNG